MGQTAIGQDRKSAAGSQTGRMQCPLWELGLLRGAAPALSPEAESSQVSGAADGGSREEMPPPSGPCGCPLATPACRGLSHSLLESECKRKAG